MGRSSYSAKTDMTASEAGTSDRKVDDYVILHRLAHQEWRRKAKMRPQTPTAFRIEISYNVSIFSIRLVSI